MLNLPLKKYWFEEIQAGRKTVEYRKASQYWARRFEKLGPGSEISLSLGYAGRKLQRTIRRIVMLPDGSDTDLGEPGPVFAIYFDA